MFSRNQREHSTAVSAGGCERISAELHSSSRWTDPGHGFDPVQSHHSIQRILLTLFIDAKRISVKSVSSVDGSIYVLCLLQSHSIQLVFIARITISSASWQHSNVSDVITCLPANAKSKTVMTSALVCSLTMRHRTNSRRHFHALK